MEDPKSVTVKRPHPSLWRVAALYVSALLWNALVCWPVVLLAHATNGQRGRLRWERPTNGPGLWGLWTTLRAGSWLLKQFRSKAPLGKEYRWGAITLGHGGLYGPEVDDDPTSPMDDWTGTEEHENSHVEQFEGVAMLMLLAGVAAWLFGAHWMIVPALPFVSWPGFVGCNTLVAVLRGEAAYSGSSHEEGAREHSGH